MTIKPEVYERFRRQCVHPVLVIDGVVQSLDNVWSLLATSIAPLEGAAGGGRSHDYH